MDPWQLVKSGKYQAAVEAYTARLREDDSPPNYNNRGIAYLNLRDFDRALLDFESADRCRPANVARGDGSGQWIGTVHWLAGDEQQAARTWRELVEDLESGEIGYTDLAGGVQSGALLFFAATWLGDAELLAIARRWLEKLTHFRRAAYFPGPIGPFLLGKITSEQLLEHASAAGHPILRDRRACQAHFFIAVAARSASDHEAMKSAFKTAADLRMAKLERTWYLARHEASRISIR